jgi:hypothetical protein
MSCFVIKKASSGPFRILVLHIQLIQALKDPTFAPAMDDSIAVRVNNGKELKSNGPM